MAWAAVIPALLLAAPRPSQSSPAPVPGPPHYTIADVGSLGENNGDTGPGDYSPGAGWSINSKGEVAGQMQREGGAFFWSQGKQTLLGPLKPLALNDDGQVVGLRAADSKHIGYHASVYHLIRWADGHTTDLGPTRALEGDVEAMSHQGYLVGSVDVGGTNGRLRGSHVALWKNGKINDLGTMGGEYGVGIGVNNKGQVIGFSAPTGVHEQLGFLWDKGRFTNLGLMPGFIDYAPIAINNKGEIAGWAFSFDDIKTHSSTGPDHAFLWEKGKFSDMGTVGGVNSHLDAINDDGDAVGWSDNKDGAWRAIVCHGGKIHDLNTLALPLPNSVTLDEAVTISAKGQIIALGGTMKDIHAYLLTPVKLPPANP